MDFCSMFCCVKKGSDRKSQGKKESTWRIFSLKELQLATNNFNYDNKLGEGGFGSVYWGQLWDGSQIAVKRLKSWSNKVEMDFSVEVQILARLRHKNLLTLRGYCAEGQERLIVYDYMMNLSLLSHLHGQYSAESHLNWTKRMNIAIGAAEGIAYLHHYATPQTIHQGIKASNILLDIDFKPQVADFGFAKLIPEYGPMSEKASERCDIYSFGILLLELVSGKKPLEKLDSTTTKRSIVEWALPLARERKFDEIADKRLNGKYVEEEVKRVVFVGLICARDRSEKRPTILEVVEMLRGDEEKFGGLESDEMFEKKSVVVVDCGAEERAEFVISDEKGTKQEIEFV